MKRKEFIKQLDKQLYFLKYEERQDILNYYNELICDKTDLGLKEEDAVLSVGSIEEIVSKLKESNPDTVEPKQGKIKTSNSHGGNILLFFLLIPVWIILGALSFEMVVVVFSFIIAGIAIEFSAIVSVIGLISSATVAPLSLHTVTIVGMIIVLFGLGIIFIRGSILLFKGVFKLIKLMFKGLSRTLRGAN